MTDGSPERRTWEATLDALEARLARQEAALAQGVVDGSFVALELPQTPLAEEDRVRAQLVLRRIGTLENQMRQLHDRLPSPVRQSPYS